MTKQSTNSKDCSLWTRTPVTMNNLLQLFFTFSVVSLLTISNGQGQDKPPKHIVLIPLKEININFGHLLLKILKNNEVSRDSANTIVNSIFEEEFNKIFSDYKTTIVERSSNGFIELDTLASYQTRQCFQTLLSATEKGHRSLLEERDFWNCAYQGLELDSAMHAIITKMDEKNNFRLLISLNLFETVTKTPFKPQTKTLIHGDAFFSAKTRVYGGKVYDEHRLSKNMYFDVFKHYVRSTARDFFSQIKANELL